MPRILPFQKQSPAHSASQPHQVPLMLVPKGLRPPTLIQSPSDKLVCSSIALFHLKTIGTVLSGTGMVFWVSRVHTWT